MKHVIIFTVLAIIICGWTLQVAADIPRAINYQGRLTDNSGMPIDTVVSMTFTIFSDTVNGSADLWHETHPSVTVQNGLFNILLGSIIPISNSVFDGSIRGLGIQIGSGPMSDSLISIISFAYAYRAGYADTASYAFFAPGSSGGGWTDNGNAVITTTSADSVGIGVVLPTAKLDVDGNINTSTKYQIDGQTVLNNDTMNNLYVGKGAAEASFGGENNTFVGVSTCPSNSGNNNVFIGYAAGYWNGSGSYNTYIGSAAGFNAQGSNNVFIGKEAGYNMSGSNKLYIANSQSGTPLIYGDFSLGRVGIGTTSPQAALHAVSSGIIPLQGENSGLMGTGVKGVATGTAGNGVYGTADHSMGVGVRGESWGSSGCGGKFVAYETSGNGVYCEVNNDGGTALRVVSNSQYSTAIHAESQGTALEVVTTGTYSSAAVFYGNVIISSKTDSNIVMELGEGLDYAEGFDVSDPAVVEPGMVLSIDSVSPGKLTVSNQPYDTKVAGIVAGADNLKSGIRLGATQFDLDVALAGRVYCYVDATQHEVNPGDLLTTSATPGYAMKVTDYSRAKGTILGKAMEKLAKGTKGKILVLVTLQ